MAMSRGSRSVLGDAMGWIFAAGVAAVAIVFAPELKAAAYQLTGLTPPDLTAASVSAPRSSEGGARSNRTVELRAERNGHFVTQAEVNGRDIEVMVDTGASVIALTFEDAERIGVAPGPSDFTHRVNTANGVSRVAPVRLERVMIGDIVVRDVPAVIAERGKLGVTLLGNSFLSRITYRMSNGRLVLED